MNLYFWSSFFFLFANKKPRAFFEALGIATKTRSKSPAQFTPLNDYVKDLICWPWYQGRSQTSLITGLSAAKLLTGPTLCLKFDQAIMLLVAKVAVFSGNRRPTDCRSQLIQRVSVRYCCGWPVDSLLVHVSHLAQATQIVLIHQNLLEFSIWVCSSRYSELLRLKRKNR